MENFDLVISDVRMPGASGVDLLNYIRQYDGEMPPIIMMSGFSDLNDESAKALGAVGLFAKPATLERLQELIDDALGRESL